VVCGNSFPHNVRRESRHYIRIECCSGGKCSPWKFSLHPTGNAEREIEKPATMLEAFSELSTAGARSFSNLQTILLAPLFNHCEPRYEREALFRLTSPWLVVEHHVSAFGCDQHMSWKSAEQNTTRAVEPELKFQAPAPGPGIQFFWHRLQHLEVFDSGSRTIWSKKQKKHCIICITRSPHRLSLGNRKSNFRLRPHHLKDFGSGFSNPKLLGLLLHSPGCKMCTRVTTWNKLFKILDCCIWKQFCETMVYQIFLLSIRRPMSYMKNRQIFSEV